MGTFVKAYVIDGELFEVYEQLGERPTFELVDADNLAVGVFDHVPDDATVVSLIRATHSKDSNNCRGYRRR